MKVVKLGINGFGRIGRCLSRIIFTNPVINNVKFDISCINDITDANTLSHLLKYDSVHGTFRRNINAKDGYIEIDDKRIKVLSEKEPERIKWADFNVDIVIESSGKFTNREVASIHLKNGAKKVIISAPAEEPDITICIGVNDKMYEPQKHNIISNASCTTNCLAPIAMILHRNFKVKRGLMTTVHSYTNDQRILDQPHKDLRRARASSLSMIPTTTGAAKAVGLVLPELKGKLDGISIRVPTPNVSIIDFVCEAEKKTNTDEINKLFLEASKTELKGIIDICFEPLVSVDFNGSSLSAIVDAGYTRVMDGNFIKVLAWYDNEWGFSNRMFDLIKLVSLTL